MPPREEVLERSENFSLSSLRMKEREVDVRGRGRKEEEVKKKEEVKREEGGRGRRRRWWWWW